ncbi:hypothetical protein O3M35_012393 [Rhynocoris fuscipes]|uniref:RNA helicase n=1 Tax=Rhynocoris fuscipes TaxID=488301 RepID=A0AAW1CS78_9HEMI
MNYRLQFQAWFKWLFGSNDTKNELEEENRVFDEIFKSEEIENKSEEEIGVVTRSYNGIIEINKIWVAYEQLLSIRVGSLVSFTKPTNEESNIVTNVELLNNINQTTNIKDKVINEGIISYIDNEKILLNPGSLIIWKNDVEITYRPEIGDYIKLENYNGFLKLYPKECCIITEEVINWDGKQGFLKNNTNITLEVCDSFYFPKIGDKVITCIIPCECDTYKWRSLNVAKVDSARYGNKKIEVKNIPVFIVPIGKEKIIDITVKNTFYKSLEIVYVKIIPEISYVTLLENPVKIIDPTIGITYKILCKGTIIGWTSFTVEFKFKNFSYNKTVKFLTTEDNNEEILLQEYNSKRPLNFVDRVHKPNFLRVKPKSYEIPFCLLEICGSSEKNKLDCMSLIQEKIPELSYGLTMQTYATYFHTLLFLEEIAQMHAMEELETVAPLVRRGEFYVFIFEDGTNYSSLCPGDTVLISNPWLNDDSEPKQTELKVWTRKQNEIYLKFKDIFNIVGNRGTLFRMKFRNNRTCTVRTHHAIDYFIKKVDIKWLFPDLIKRNPFKNCTFSKKILLPNEIQYFSNELDFEQREAVYNIVFTTENLEYPYLLFGPPGTGKTVTLVEITLQTLRQYPNCRILIAAPSNSAVDTLCERLIINGNINNTELIRLISFNYSQLGQLPVNLVEYAAVLSHSPEIQDDIRVCDVENLTQFKIIVGTLNTLGIINCLGIRNGHFTHVFIDEAGQTTEPDTLIPLATIKPGFTRVVLAGDPNQLGPVIISQIAKAYHLGESLMMRLMNYPMYSRCFENVGNTIKPKVATMLRKNYRALPTLVNLLSDLFYKNQLEAMMSTVKSREAEILNILKSTSFGTSGSNLIVIKVNGKEEYLHGEKNSFWNIMEASRISVIVLELYKIGISAQQIGIITPYSLQVKKIKECFKSLCIEPPKIGTVEEFQGSERDIIIISLVRTTLDECRLSFICDPKRANVSLSRAKVMNIILGYEVTLRMSHLWEKVLDKSFIINPNINN